MRSLTYRTRPITRSRTTSTTKYRRVAWLGLLADGGEDWGGVKEMAPALDDV